MKSINNEQFTRVMKALRTAYNQKERLDTGDMWQTRVMGHVLSLGVVSAKAGYFELFQQFVWRLTPVAFVLIGILSMALVKMSFFSDYEFTKALVSNSSDLVTLAMYSGS
jgi:hypothetical protein